MRGHMLNWTDTSLPMMFSRGEYMLNNIEFALKATQAVNRTPEEQIQISTERGFALFYYVWVVLREKYGPEKAKEMYGYVWEHVFRMGFEQVKESMGIDVVNDIPTLGQIRRQMSLLYPMPHEVQEISQDKYVGHIKWCPNPVYSVPDSHIRKMAYYRDESDLTVWLYNKLVEWAGMSDWVEGKLEKAICLGDDVCECVFVRKEGK